MHSLALSHDPDWWRGGKILIHFYDESLHNSINLNEQNWLEYRENLISRWSNKEPSDLGSFNYGLRLIITHLKKISTRFDKKPNADRTTSPKSHLLNEGWESSSVFADPLPEITNFNTR